MWWLKDLLTTPPGNQGRWTYIHPESGMKIDAGDYRNLLINIKKHDEANNYPVGAQWEQNIQNLICEQIGADKDQWCAQGMKGMGDLVHNILAPAVYLVDSAFGTNLGGCGGCAKRRQQLNEQVPFH